MSNELDNQLNVYSMTAQEAAQTLDVETDVGLSSSEVRQRQQQYGLNQLAEKKKEPGWQAFLRQYHDLMQYVLLGAAIINQVFTGDLGTTLVLVGLTVFNAVLGLRGEAKAEETPMFRSSICARARAAAASRERGVRRGARCAPRTGTSGAASNAP